MALIIEDLTVVKQGRELVRSVSMSVERGQVTAVLGANGAGKSELVLAVAGMLPIAQGHISVDGRAIQGCPPDVVRLAGVAAVPEGHRVLSKLSVDDNLRVAGSMLAGDQVGPAVAEVYALFPELAERQRQLAGTMSGGQQQMLSIGHALMARPKYLLIDEMSLGLAPLIVKRLVRTIESLVDKGVGVILVEQFTEVALSVATSAVVMRTGDVRYSGPASEIRTRPEILEAAYF
ncbi:branched-chain amino acid ABC transporter ATP-binding protein [Hydrogenophaga taeniospiralis CCUG 15921]|uniref:Branched-chain amino acid ABC transporter ATP-binding protein n=1 Tax=Hydrogenophaga taeniospiralis CCUG 15921 TaxID=1281780 RepID=A0A9X4NNZ1_9BURK|nr:ABC transporter ATP-binding protein [Hydrogenophaga taeniospiralis]MDG5974532.1 branched-chain amino acid ABC transporter ATP-binding protein [Hydrogenophaga taeniospiralis CCUG 15921]